MATQAAAPQTGTNVLGEWLALLDKEGVTARNRDAHRMGVERFAEYMKPRLAEEATASDVRGFLGYLGELGVSEQSQGVYRQILDRWVAYAMRARRQNATAEAAVNALTGMLEAESPVEAEAEAEPEIEIEVEIDPPAPEPIVEVFVAPEREPEADATMVFEAGEAMPLTAMPVTPMPHDEPITEAQADSTWPFAHARPAAPAGSATLAAAFDRASAGEGPIAAVTIDFASDAPGAASDDTFLLTPAAFVAEPACEPFAAPQQSEIPATPETNEMPAPSDGFTFGPSEPAPAAPPSSAFGGFSFQSTDEPPASLFATPTPAATFGDSESTFASPDPAADPDATPARPIPAAVPLGFPAQRAVPQRDAATGDHVMGDAGPSIALGGATPALRKAAEDTARAAAHAASMPATELKAKVQGWGLRANGSERNDLDLTQIRNLVATGAITPQTLIRRPGGEWMRAGEYHPLRSVFQQAYLDASQGGPRPTTRPVDPLAHPAAMAWLGAVLGAVAGAGAWWLVAVIAGAEVLPMALLVAVLSGGLAAWLGRGESFTGIGASAVATLGAMIVGRAAVYQTLKSGVIGGPNAGPADPFVFLAASATASSITWWGIAIVVAAAVGGVTALMRKR